MTNTRSAVDGDSSQSSRQNDQRASTTCEAVDADALGVGGIADSEPLTPAELADSVDVIASVELLKITEGYSVIDDGDEFSYFFVVYRVIKDFSEKESTPDLGDEIYVRLDQGPISVKTGEPSFGIELFRKALPEGTRAILYLNDVTDEVERSDLLLPEGYRLFGIPPQGAVIDNCGKLEADGEPLSGQWDQYETLEDLEADLEGR